jgi:hypothetical protein
VLCPVLPAVVSKKNTKAAMPRRTPKQADPQAMRA